MWSCSLQKAMKGDRFLSDELTEQLFPENGAIFGRDLAALNIQRGRDHGLPGWNAFRRRCKLDQVCKWTDKPNDITQENWDLLRTTYGENSKPGNVDLFAAGLLETPVDGGVVGKTFSCIIGEQFERLQRGDRFFLTNKGENGQSNKNPYTDDQIGTVLQRTLRDIICDNTNVQMVPVDAFKNPNDISNPLQDCRVIKNNLDISNF